MFITGYMALMLTLYTCYSVEASRNKIICEGKTDELRCNCSKTIVVESANYGRTEPDHFCNDERTSDTNCINDVLTNITDRCNHYDECIIESSNAFVDKCKGTYKYMNITYECTSTVVTAFIECPNNVTECADYILNEAYVTWEPAEVFHIEAGEFETTHENGSLFPIGETLVNVTTKIVGCDDTISCSFSVFVEDCYPVSACHSNNKTSAVCIVNFSKQPNIGAAFTEFEIANSAVELDTIVQHSREITEMDSLEIDNANLKGIVSIVTVVDTDNYSTSLTFSNISLNLGFNYIGEVTIVALFWEYDFLRTPQLSENITSNEVYLHSGLLSISTYDVNNTAVDTRVEYTIQVLETDDDLIESVMSMNYNVTYVCGFINLNSQNWSTSGCYVVNINVTWAVCRCDHLTSFGVLMQVTSYETESIHEEALSALTTIGLIMSIILLTITETVYVLLKGLWKSLRNNIHKNLIANMIAFYTLFLIGIDKIEYTIFCKVTSVCLYLLLMNIFFWMFGEAVFLAFKVIYRTPSRHNRLRNYILFCYLVPVILVTPVAIFKYDSYGNDYCWLDTQSNWCIVFPASIIILFSMVILVMMVRIIYQRAGTNLRMGRSETEDHRQLRKSVKGAVFLVPILGVTWIFGPLSVNGESLFMQYLFVILNSFQGVFIFIVYCLLDNEVQTHWKNRRKGQVHTVANTQTSRT
ncbi:adhesion G protein-coupled receptor L2-like [Antedon mediterranea]|uniref:adhesion G protein-coupled receptor L2-like n=1 Tax=Antedon mediterranea TaxID=105859 RepID=UPI003AF801DC